MRTTEPKNTLFNLDRRARTKYFHVTFVTWLRGLSLEREVLLQLVPSSRPVRFRVVPSRPGLTSSEWAVILSSDESPSISVPLRFRSRSPMTSSCFSQPPGFPAEYYFVFDHFLFFLIYGYLPVSVPIKYIVRLVIFCIVLQNKIDFVSPIVWKLFPSSFVDFSHFRNPGLVRARGHST